MSKMLGRDGAWFYGYPCGKTHRIMRKSGRMKIKKETRRAADESRGERGGRGPTGSEPEAQGVQEASQGSEAAG